MRDPSYPIGRFDWNAPVTAETRPALIEQIAAAPGLLRRAVEGCTNAQLDTPYRAGGWTVRQVVHHLPESHMHSFLRFRLALTEDEPTIKPYDEARCAELHDCLTMPPECSLALLENLHIRWVVLLRAMTDQDFARRFRHPELGAVRLDTNLALYAWHGRHHTAQINGVRRSMCW
jgi:hypothetical protein